MLDNKLSKLVEESTSDARTTWLTVLKESNIDFKQNGTESVELTEEGLVVTTDFSKTEISEEDSQYKTIAEASTLYQESLNPTDKLDGRTRGIIEDLLYHAEREYLDEMFELYEDLFQYDSKFLNDEATFVEAVQTYGNYNNDLWFKAEPNLRETFKAWNSQSEKDEIIGELEEEAFEVPTLTDNEESILFEIAMALDIDDTKEIVNLLQELQDIESVIVRENVEYFIEVLSHVTLIGDNSGFGEFVEIINDAWDLVYNPIKSEIELLKEQVASMQKPVKAKVQEESVASDNLVTAVKDIIGEVMAEVGLDTLVDDKEDEDEELLELEDDEEEVTEEELLEDCCDNQVTVTPEALEDYLTSNPEVSKQEEQGKFIITTNDEFQDILFEYDPKTGIATGIDSDFMSAIGDIPGFEMIEEAVETSIENAIKKYNKCKKFDFEAADKETMGESKELSAALQQDGVTPEDVVKLITEFGSEDGFGSAELKFWLDAGIVEEELTLTIEDEDRIREIHREEEEKEHGKPFEEIIAGDDDLIEIVDDVDSFIDLDEDYEFEVEIDMEEEGIADKLIPIKDAVKQLISKGLSSDTIAEWLSNVVQPALGFVVSDQMPMPVEEAVIEEEDDDDEDFEIIDDAAEELDIEIEDDEDEEVEIDEDEDWDSEDDDEWETEEEPDEKPKGELVNIEGEEYNLTEFHHQLASGFSIAVDKNATVFPFMDNVSEQSITEWATETIADEARLKQAAIDFGLPLPIVSEYLGDVIKNALLIAYLMEQDTESYIAIEGDGETEEVADEAEGEDTEEAEGDDDADEAEEETEDEGDDDEW
jgi:hypothetical protein